MSWKIPDLSDYLFAGAKNGGPIGETAQARRRKSWADTVWISLDEGRAEGNVAWQASSWEAEDPYLYLVRYPHKYPLCMLQALFQRC